MESLHVSETRAIQLSQPSNHHDFEIILWVAHPHRYAPSRRLDLPRDGGLPPTSKTHLSLSKQLLYHAMPLNHVGTCLTCNRSRPCLCGLNARVANYAWILRSAICATLVRITQPSCKRHCYFMLSHVNWIYPYTTAIRTRQLVYKI